MIPRPIHVFLVICTGPLIKVKWNARLKFLVGKITAFCKRYCYHFNKKMHVVWDNLTEYWVTIPSFKANSVSWEYSIAHSSIAADFTTTILQCAYNKITRFWLVEGSTINPTMYSVMNTCFVSMRSVLLCFSKRHFIHLMGFILECRWFYFYQIKSYFQVLIMH